MEMCLYFFPRFELEFGGGGVLHSTYIFDDKTFSSGLMRFYHVIVLWWCALGSNLGGASIFSLCYYHGGLF